MEDNNQSNAPSNLPPASIEEMDERLTQLFSAVHRDIQYHSHVTSSLAGHLNIRPINSLAPNIPSNLFYFHDLLRSRNPRPNATNIVLENSLHDQGGVRHIISDDGKNQLISDKFEKGKFMNSACPIMQEEFSDGDVVTVLPCKHCFYPDGIMYWLENNKAECPVCRHKLLSKEVSNNDHDSDDDVQPFVDDSHEEDDEDAETEEDEDDDHDGDLPNPLSLDNNHPTLDIIGNAIQRPMINPIFTQIIENMVRENMQNIMNVTDTSANIVPLQQENNINTSEEDSMDLQMAIYASMNNNEDESDDSD
jgi:hypothetical protein